MKIKKRSSKCFIIINHFERRRGEVAGVTKQHATRKWAQIIRVKLRALSVDVDSEFEA